MLAPQEIRRLRQIITDLNTGLYNPVGLNILWPHDVAFLYVGLVHASYQKGINGHLA